MPCPKIVHFSEDFPVFSWRLCVRFYFGCGSVALSLGGFARDFSVSTHCSILKLESVCIMMLSAMRTTVTLDPDVDRLLREEMQRSGTTFRQALNQVIRRSLAGNSATKRRPFKLRPRRLSLRPGLDPAMLQHLEEDLEIESFIEKTRKLSRS